MKGKFIVLDGGEGCGKSAMINHLKTVYQSSKAVFTREPGGSVFGERIRDTILSPEAKDADGVTQFALVWASRRDHIKNLIEPALSAGQSVVSDRFDSSTYAYQVRAQEATELQELFFEMRKIVLGDVVPDLYIFLDVDPKVGLGRAKGRGEEATHFDERDLEFHECVRDGFKEFLEYVPHTIIDAGQSIEEVKEAVEEAVREILTETKPSS